MKNSKKIIFMTMLGILGAATAANATGFTQKVVGMLHNEIKVSVEGKATSMKPVIINGQVYLPASSEAKALGYTMNYDQAHRSITINKSHQSNPNPTNPKPPVNTPVDQARSTGVIVNVQPASNGQYRIELLGKGSNSWVILTVDKDTVLKNDNHKNINVKDLRAGQRIDVSYASTTIMTFPIQSHATQITVKDQAMVTESVIQAIDHTEDGWVVKFGEGKGGSLIATLTVTSGKETSVLTPDGQSVDWNDVKVGNKVRVYYGPNVTASKMPSGPLYTMVVLDNFSRDSIQGGIPALTADDIKSYRDLSWNLLTDKRSVTTSKEDAKVELLNSNEASVLTTNDSQKASLAALQAANDELVVVTYQVKKQKDVVLGPIMMAFNPTTREFMGYFPRM